MMTIPTKTTGTTTTGEPAARHGLTVRARITASIAVLLLIALSGAGVIVYAIAYSTTNETAQNEIEQEFDEIASGKLEWHKMIDQFYKPFHKVVSKTEKVERSSVQNKNRELGVDPKTGLNIYAKLGKFGAYVQLGENPEDGVVVVHPLPCLAVLQRGGVAGRSVTGPQVVERRAGCQVAVGRVHRDHAVADLLQEGDGIEAADHRVGRIVLHAEMR